MEMLGFLEGAMRTRGVLKSVSVGHGVLFVMTSGMQMMLLWYVHNLDLTEQV